MENYFNEFIIIAIAHFIALLSPGADFVYIVNSALTNKTKVALGASIGIAFSNGFYILLCLLGYATFFSNSTLIMSIIYIFGGTYLLYLGYTILKNNNSKLSFNKLENKSSFYKEIKNSFLVSFLNPKISIFYISLFALVIDKKTPITVQLFYAIWMFFVVLFWDSILILFITKYKIKNKLQKIVYINNILAFILIAIGIGLLYSFYIHLELLLQIF